MAKVALVSFLFVGVTAIHQRQAKEPRHHVSRIDSDEFELVYRNQSERKVTHVLAAREHPATLVSVLSDSSSGFFLALDTFETSTSKKVADHTEGALAGPVDWTVLFGFTVAAFFFDAYVLSRFMDGMKGHFMVFMCWCCLAVVYNATVIAMHGAKMGVQWWTAYFFEWLLNVDNLFIFIVVFGAFRTPHELRPKAMLYWVPFAIILRIVLFTVMEDAFDMCGLIKIACGLMLIWSGWEASKGEDDDEEFDVDSLKSVKCFRWLLGERGLSEFDEESQGLFVQRNGKWRATMLVLLVFTLSVVDFFFVFDSVAAKVAQIPCQYIANSAEVVALFGMRSFIVFLEDVVESFALLKYGICVVLAFLGAQLVLGGAVPGHFDITPMQSVRVICVILATSAVLSKVKESVSPKKDEECEKN